MLFVTGIVEGKKTGTDMIYSQDPNLSIHIPWPSVRKPLRTEDASSPQQGSGESTLGVTREGRACCVNSWESQVQSWNTFDHFQGLCVFQI